MSRLMPCFRWQILLRTLLPILLPALGTLSGCGEPPRPKTVGDVARGERLVAQYQCGACHRIPGVPDAAGLTAPALAGFARRSYIAGHVPNGPDHLVRWLQSPAAVVPATRMPDMGLSARDAQDIAAYLLALH